MKSAPPSPVEDKQKRLELNRLAAVKSRQKKKQEIDVLRQQRDFLSQTKAHLELKLNEYERMLQDQTVANTLVHGQMFDLLLENQRLKSLLKEQ